MGKHNIVMPIEPPRAVKWTIAGSVPPERMRRTDEPEILDDSHDSLRLAEMDLNPGFDELKDEIKRDCSVM